MHLQKFVRNNFSMSLTDYINRLTGEFKIVQTSKYKTVNRYIVYAEYSNGWFRELFRMSNLWVLVGEYVGEQGSSVSAFTYDSLNVAITDITEFCKAIDKVPHIISDEY